MGHSQESNNDKQGDSDPIEELLDLLNREEKDEVNPLEQNGKSYERMKNGVRVRQVAANEESKSIQQRDNIFPRHPA